MNAIKQEATLFEIANITQTLAENEITGSDIQLPVISTHESESSIIVAVEPSIFVTMSVISG